MKGNLLTLTENAFLRFSTKSFGNVKGISLLRSKSISSSNLSFNKELKHKSFVDVKSKNTKKNKILRTNGQTTKNEDVYILNGKVFHIQSQPKQRKEEIINKESLQGKSYQILENLQNYSKESTMHNTDIIYNNHKKEIHRERKEEENTLHIYKERNEDAYIEDKNIKNDNRNESEDSYKTLEGSIQKNSEDVKMSKKSIKEEELKRTQGSECNINAVGANVNTVEKEKWSSKGNDKPKEMKEPNEKKEVKTDVYDILKEINNEHDKKEIEKFLNFLLLYKNNSTISTLGNAISFYFCTILSEDLKDLKTYYRDGVRLSVHTFFSTLRELNEVQISKMMNLYLSEYFTKIFTIFRDNKITLHFENLEIHNIKLLGIYNMIGIIRNEGKRIKKEHIKKFLYQYICIDDQNLALFKSNNRMKFLGNIIKNGTTTRMHLLINASFDLLTYHSESSDLITSTKFKNVFFEFLLENELTNPNFSMQPYEVINLKASGWTLVDVNNILNGNYPYE